MPATPITTSPPDIDSTFQYDGTVSHHHGNHDLKFGAGLIRRQARNVQSAFPFGQYSFGLNSDQAPIFTAAQKSTNILASTLAGAFTSPGPARNVNLFVPDYRSWEPSAFAQDTWKATHWLTLIYGLRYDVFTPFTEAHNHISNFDFNSAIAGASPDAALQVAKVNGVSATAGIKTDYSNVAPRVGFMQFRFAGSERGVFWENRALDGVPPRGGLEWKNFGGDKVWPAPQKDWDARTGCAWPPPVTFDAASSELRTEGQHITLISAVDPDYGLQVLRHISMRPGLPVMDITSRYCKVEGPSVHVAVWVVTQLCGPQSAFALLPEAQNNAPDYTQLQGPAPLGARRNGRLFSLRRDPTHNLKIAIDSHSLVWMDDEYVLRIDASSESESADKCSMAVYTNMDPLQYVELECEGQAAQLAVGSTLELTSTYTLALRSLEDETAQASKTFGLAT